MRNRRRDRKYFRKTSSKTKLINIRPKIMRGGICL